MCYGQFAPFFSDILVYARLSAGASVRVANPGRELIPCRAESKSPQLDWSRAWLLSTKHGLPSPLLAFLWKMLHDILPCQTRLFRLRMPNASSDICTLCDQNEVGDLTHSLVSCSYNGGAGLFLLDRLRHVLPNLLPHQVTQLDLDVEDEKQLPVVYLTASVLSQVWDCRMKKKPCQLLSIRADLEASVNILRKSRFYRDAEELSSLLVST